MFNKLFRNGHWIFLMAVFSLNILVSCSHSRADTLKSEFGDDAWYYMGLRAIDDGDVKSAIRYFEDSRANGTYYIAKKSAQALTQLGTLEQKTAGCVYLAKNFKDTDSLYLACSNLEAEHLYSEIISVTSNLDILNTPDSIIQMRLNALYELNDSHFEEEVFNWFSKKAASYNQYEIYQKYIVFKENQFFKNLEKEKAEDQFNRRRHNEEILYAPASALNKVSPSPVELTDADQIPDFSLPEHVLSPEHKFIAFRMAVFTKDYKIALNQGDEILSLIKARHWDIPLFYSDLGKAHLFGTDDFKASAQKFDRYAAQLSGLAKYYAYFYAARLYSKTGRYQEQAVARFKSALSASVTDDQYDNTLWYLLDNQSRISTDDIIVSLRKYGSNIHNSAYFDDLFEPLSVILLRGQKWQDFYDVWQIIDSYASPEISAKYSYIAGRLIEEGLAKGQEGLATRQAVEAFTHVLYGKAGIYYKACALERLNIIDNDAVQNILCYNGKEEETEYDQDAEKLLNGYCLFGFPQKVYDEWNKLRTKISPECSIQCAAYLQTCGLYNNDYNVQSLRIASRTKSAMTGRIPDELLRLVYPKYFEKPVVQASMEFNLSQDIIFSLIRSESFFDAKISSSAGACGLTQLMRGTAEDEARKLKMTKYDINNPDDNIRMGTHYLSDLIQRAPGYSPLLALFGYNAGPQKVKSWVSMAQSDWQTTQKHAHKITGISMDLFLETLPFEETREYGRKIIGASVMYNYLYNDKTPAESVRFFLDN